MNDQSKVPWTNRFSPKHIWNGHLKGLKNRDFRAVPPTGVPDLFARILLYGLPTVGAAAALWFGGTVAAIDGLLAAAGVLGGGLFMAFTQVASWREQYTQRLAERPEAERPQRYSLDETVAHILMATYGCFAVVAVIVVGANFADGQERLTGIWAALAIFFGTYVLLLIGLILPKLYSAYAVTHNVDSEMSGLSH